MLRFVYEKEDVECPFGVNFWSSAQVGANLISVVLFLLG
jgi:hypothetical protein